MTDVERPLCECHGEPMLKAGQRGGRQYWRCMVENRMRRRIKNPRKPALREWVKAEGVWMSKQDAAKIRAWKEGLKKKR